MTWRLKAMMNMRVWISAAGAVLAGSAAVGLTTLNGWPHQVSLAAIAGASFLALVALPLEATLMGAVVTSFLSPYFSVFGLRVRLDQVFLLAATVRLALHLLRSRGRAPAGFRGFATYWVLAWVASAFVSWFAGTLLADSSSSWRDVLIILTRVQLLLLVLVTRAVNWDEQRLRRLFTYVLFASFLVTLLGLTQALHIGVGTAFIAKYFNKLDGPPIAIPTWNRITATMDAEPNLFGNFIAVIVAFQSALLIKGFRKYWWLLPIALLNVALVVMNASRSSMFAVALAVTVIFLLRRPSVLLLGVLTVVLAVSLNLGVRLPALTAYRLQPVLESIQSGRIQDAGLSARIFMWNRDITQLLQTNPVLGIGPDVNSLILSDSEYVEIALKYGLVGLGLHLALLLWLLRVLPYKQPGLVGTVSLGLIGAIFALMFASLTGIYFYSPRIIATFLPLAVAAASWKDGVVSGSKGL